MNINLDQFLTSTSIAYLLFMIALMLLALLFLRYSPPERGKAAK